MSEHSSLDLVRAKSELAQSEVTDAQKKIEEQKKRTAVLYPVFSFAVENLQGLVKELAKQSGDTNILCSEMEYPENFFEKSGKSTISFNSNAVWLIEITKGWGHPIGFEAGYDPGSPFLRVTFVDSRKAQTGRFHIQLTEDGKKFRFFYETTLPFPKLENIQHLYDMPSYDTPVKEALQRIVAAQLLQVRASAGP